MDIQSMQQQKPQRTSANWLRAKIPECDLKSLIAYLVDQMGGWGCQQALHQRQKSLLPNPERDDAWIYLRLCEKGGDNSRRIGADGEPPMERNREKMIILALCQKVSRRY